MIYNNNDHLGMAMELLDEMVALGRKEISINELSFFSKSPLEKKQIFHALEIMGGASNAKCKLVGDKIYKSTKERFSLIFDY